MPQMKFKLWLPVLLAAVLAACSQSHQAVEAPAATNSAVPSQSAQAAEKLGTGWGDEVESPVHSVDLRRVSQEPLAQSVLNYSSKDYRGRSVNSIALASGKVELSVRGDDGSLLPIFRDKGNYYLRGTDGQRPLQNFFSSNNRNPKTGFRLFSPPITPNFTQIPP
mgnify:CR=1 FL=1